MKRYPPGIGNGSYIEKPQFSAVQPKASAHLAMFSFRRRPSLRRLFRRFFLIALLPVFCCAGNAASAPICCGAPSPIGFVVSVSPGWNLLGNSTATSLDVAARFGDASKVITVWKWVNGTDNWAFYAPSQTDGGASYASARGYGALTTIESGEGFWLNAKQGFNLTLPSANQLPTSGDQLRSGWNLIAISENLTPSQYNAALGSDVASLWAWNSSQAKWYFHSPRLATQGGTALTDYIASHNYLDFSANSKTLGQAVGFWVYRPATLSVTDTQSGQAIQLTTRQLLEVKLAGNSTTGYTWNFDDNSIDVIVREGASLYVLNTPVQAGSGGVSIWKFNAVKPGNGTLRFEYRRASVSGDTPLQVVQFPITVISDTTTTSTTTTTTTTTRPTTTSSSTTSSIPATTTTSATTTSSTATTTTTTTSTTSINAPPCDFTTTTKEWDFGADGGDGWFSVQITSSPCLIRSWIATGPNWISRIYTYGMSNGNGNVGFYVQPNDTGTAPIPDRQGNIRVSWNNGLSSVDFLVKQKGASPFQGTLFGTWSGICHYSVGDISGSGTLRMDIDINGGVTGTYAGDENGTITGSVASTGGLTTSGGVSTGGGSGGILWSGTFARIGGALTGGGSWTDSSGCSGTWGG